MPHKVATEWQTWSNHLGPI